MEKLSGAAKPKPEETTEEGSTGPSSSSTTQPAPTPSVPTPAAETSEPARPKINIRPSATAAPTSDNPFTKLGTRPATDNASLPVRQSATSSLKRPHSEVSEQSNPLPIAKKTNPAEEDIKSWESRILGQIFRITLDPDQRTDASNHRLIYLPNLRKELEEEKASIRLNTERLSEAIFEAGSTIPHNKPVLDYLLPCWKRVIKASKGLRGYANQKDRTFKEAKRLCMSNIIFACTLPDLFGSVKC